MKAKGKYVVNEGYFKQYIEKMKGYDKVHIHLSISDALMASVGAFICMLTILELTQFTDSLFFIASFGASSMLVFATWNAPVGQPRNIIGSHLISSSISLLILQFFGSTPITISLALCCSIFLIMMTETFHPPACGNPIFIMVGGYGWDFLFQPILIGTIIIVIFGLIFNNLHPKRRYPMYW